MCGVGGKSAVLTAITVALGGKATSTGRGSGLRAFIREGQPYVSFSLDIFIFGDECNRA
jgi:chromosome segregation ATPase